MCSTGAEETRGPYVLASKLGVLLLSADVEQDESRLSMRGSAHTRPHPGQGRVCVEEEEQNFSKTELLLLISFFSST